MSSQPVARTARPRGHLDGEPLNAVYCQCSSSTVLQVVLLSERRKRKRKRVSETSIMTGVGSAESAERVQVDRFADFAMQLE